MFETHIYGCSVQSDVSLLDTSHDLKAAFPGMLPIRLMRSPSPSFMRLQHRFVVPISHGREVSVFTDRDNRQLESGQPWIFEIEDLLQFSGCSGSSDIYYRGDERATAELVSFWFVHVVLPYILMAERDYCFLHAAAVSLGDRSLVFMAESHGGKSTLADFFLQQGHELISDDKVAIHEGESCYLSVPSHPYFRPFRKFEDLGFHSNAYSLGLKPVAAIYLLKKSETEEIAIRRIKGTEAFSCLMDRSIILFPGSWNACLPILAGIAHDVPVFELKRPWGLEFQPETYKAIVENSSLES
jgi:hypothetical protein